MNTVISFEKSTVNESRFLNVYNRVHNYQNDDSKTIQKKALFRKRKLYIINKFIK